MQKEAAYLEAKRKRKATLRSLQQGSKSILEPYDEELLRYIFELREQHFGVSVLIIIDKAKTLSAAFCHKSCAAQDAIICQWIKWHNFVHRCVTHQCQRLAVEVEEDALWFIEEMKAYLKAPFCHRDYILNMDQTAIYYSMMPASTINLRGERTINI